MSSKHEHNWCYVHTVYGDDGLTLIRRYCDDCGASQVGEVRRWRPEKKTEFDTLASHDGESDE